MNALIHKGICNAMNDLYVKKNADYGDSFARTRDIVPFYTLGKIADKYVRLEHLMLSGDTPNNESIEDTLFDLANYCIMELTERQAEREAIAETIPDLEIELPDLDASFVDVSND